LNVENDTAAAGVQSIILIEDSVRSIRRIFRLLYETLKQSLRLISEG